MDERELIQLYLQQQKPPILDDIMPDDLKFIPLEQENEMQNILHVSCRLNINDEFGK